MDEGGTTTGGESGEIPPEVCAAAAELSVTPDTPPTDIRRAYLRLIKQRKPEVDPDGFRKAREAFELLTRWAGFLQQRKFIELRKSAPEIPPPVNAAAPIDPPPPAAPPEPPKRDWDGVKKLLMASDLTGGRALIRELLAANVGPPPSLGAAELVNLLLSLQADTPGPDARETMKVYVAWIDRGQNELVFAGALDRWLLIRELAKLPDEVPREVEVLFARGLLTGNLNEALKQIEAFTIANPERSDQALIPLADKSPLLQSILARVLNIELIRGLQKPPQRTAARVEAPAGSSAGAKPWVGMLIIGWVLFRLINLGGITGFADPPPQQAVEMPSSPSKPSRWTGLIPSDPTSMTESVTQVCRVATVDQCNDAMTVQLKIASRDCAEARAAYGRLATVPGPAMNAVISMKQQLDLCETNKR